MTNTQKRVLRSDIFDQNRQMQAWLANNALKKPAIKAYIKRMLSIDQIKEFKRLASIEHSLMIQDLALVDISTKLHATD